MRWPAYTALGIAVAGYSRGSRAVCASAALIPNTFDSKDGESDGYDAGDDDA